MSRNAVSVCHAHSGQAPREGTAGGFYFMTKTDKLFTESVHLFMKLLSPRLFTSTIELCQKILSVIDLYVKRDEGGRIYYF